jgi:hypothetical protein
MLQSSMFRRSLRATLCEIELGLFSVSYRCDAPARLLHDLPIYQVAACLSDAERKIELRARACGFDTVIWEHSLMAPAHLQHLADEVLHPKAGKVLAAGK